MNALRNQIPRYLLTFLTLSWFCVSVQAQNNEMCNTPESIDVNGVSALSWQPNNELIAIANDDIVQVWNLSSFEVETEFIGDSVLIQSLDWSGDGQYLAASGNQIAIWDVQQEQRLDILPFPEYERMGIVDWHPNENKLLFSRLNYASEDPSGSRFYVFDLDNNQITPIGSPFTSQSIGKWSPDGAFIVIAAFEILQVYASDSYEKVLQVELDNASNIHDIAWSFDNTKLAIGVFEIGVGPRIFVTDIQTGNIIYKISGYEGFIYSIDWHPFTDKLLTGGEDKIVRIWDLVRGEVILFLEEHDESIIEVIWSFDGQTFITASPNGQVLLWDACNLL